MNLFSFHSAKTNVGLSSHMHSICPHFSDVTGDHAVNAVPQKWGESPSSPKAFQYLCPVILAHISSLYDGASKSRVRRGESTGLRTRR